MATATNLPPNIPHRGETVKSGAAPTNALEEKQPPESLFVKFEDKQATVFVNTRHIVRFEYHPSTRRAHLQLTDGHHYYLSDAMAVRVIEQLEKCP